MTDLSITHIWQTQCANGQVRYFVREKSLKNGSVCTRRISQSELNRLSPSLQVDSKKPRAKPDCKKNSTSVQTVSKPKTLKNRSKGSVDSTGKKQTKKKELRKEPRKVRFAPHVQHQHASSGFNQQDMDSISKLRATYKERYEFPKWISERNLLPNNKGKNGKKAAVLDFARYAQTVTAYYDAKDDPAIVSRLLQRREPTNIEMKKDSYNEEVLQENFGYRKGYYGTFFEQHGRKQLAPNIGVYCQTPLLLKNQSSFVDIHVFNAIGYAFDHVEQPDYQYFISSLKRAQEIKDTELQQNLYVQLKVNLIARYKDVFRKIYQCAREKKMKRVVMSIIGGNSFSRFFPGRQEKFQEKVFAPAFVSFFREYILNLPSPIQTYFMMGHEREIAYLEIRQQLRDFRNENQYGPLERYVQFPKFIDNNPETMNQEWLDRTLFVNAWDPWSVAGNGNGSDKSLDGWVGRSTMIGPLTFPGTNRWFLQGLHGSGRTSEKLVPVPLSTPDSGVVDSYAEEENDSFEDSEEEKYMMRNTYKSRGTKNK